MLFLQVHIGHRHASVYGLAHVVDGEQSHLHGGEGFHFHARLAHCFYCRRALHRMAGFIDCKL